jgi:hypothetical protein
MLANVEARRMISEFITSYQTRHALWLISGFTFLIGYLEYIYSTRLVLAEHRAPYPVWMHSFYFAHDVTGAVVFARLAMAHGFFWVFTATSAALLIWNLFEIFNLIMAVRYERQEIWGAATRHPVTERQAWCRIAGQIVLMLALVNVLRVFMHDEVMFKWFALTNVLIAVGPGFLWERRGTRQGASVGLALVILVGTINTFLPPGLGMWTTALGYFNQFWFYAIGVVATAYALRNVFVLLRLPPKPSVDGRRAIW